MPLNGVVQLQAMQLMQVATDNFVKEVLLLSYCSNFHSTKESLYTVLSVTATHSHKLSQHILQ